MITLRKSACLFCILLLPILNVWGQHRNTSFRIDTVSVKNDTAFVRITRIEKGVVRHEGTALLVPDSCIVPRFRFFRDVYKKQVECATVVEHGESISYLDNGNMQVRIFYRGALVRSAIYDRNRNEIQNSPTERTVRIGPCGTEQKTIIFAGKSRKRK